MGEESPFNGNGSATNGHRFLPQAPEAEKGLICSFLIDPDHVGALCHEKGITSQHVHLAANKSIFVTLEEMWGKGEPIDLSTVTTRLHTAGILSDAGGPAYITEVSNYLPTAANASSYADTIIAQWRLREGIRICSATLNRCYDEQDSGPEIFTQTRAQFEKLEHDFSKTEAKPLKEVVVEVINELEQSHLKGVTGLSTGFKDVDELIDGMHEEELIVIAARPSMGKSAIAMNIAEHVALDLKKTVTVFSLEMSNKQLVQRLLCGRARVNPRRIKQSGMLDRDSLRITAAGSALASSKLLIEDDSIYRSIEKTVARANQLKRRHPDLSLIIGDYFQLMHSELRQRNDNRTTELNQVSAGWKLIAKTLKIPVILLAQVQRPDGRGGPLQLHNLKDCGALEQDADVVAFLDRPEMRLEGQEREEAKGIATLDVKKQRNGPLDPVPLTFIAEYTRFENAAREPEEHPALPLDHRPNPKTKERSES